MSGKDTVQPAHLREPGRPSSDVPDELPDGLTIDDVMDATKRSMFGVDNPGFCLACGAETEGCEPDAEHYPCDQCDERMVFGAEWIFVRYADAVV